MTISTERLLTDDEIMEVIVEAAPWKSEPKLYDLLTREKSPPLFPQATYDAPSYRATALVRAIEKRLASRSGVEGREAVIEECAKLLESRAEAQSQFQKSAYDRGDDIGGHGHWKAQGELLAAATTLRTLRTQESQDDHKL